ncbi:MAG TPA: DUF4350 domain-containing protein [Verrucomicrobiae bacterium]|nr:DUF4350 domain-containing protein [Verrucomicrobiae bacterium]
MKFRIGSLAPLTLLFSLLAGTAGAEPVVLFDQGHGERFSITQKTDLGISSLADTLRSEGLTVTGTDSPLSDRSLAGAAALVLPGPFQALEAEEVEAVVRFVAGGGKLVVLLHISPPALPLLHRLGVAASNGVIHEPPGLEGRDTDFLVTSLERHPLAEGVESFVVHGGWAILPTQETARVIARTSAASWIDLNRDGKLSERDARGPFAMVIAGTSGSGAFAILGDDAIFQNRFLTGGNLRMARNLAAWIRGK